MNKPYIMWELFNGIKDFFLEHVLYPHLEIAHPFVFK